MCAIVTRDILIERRKLKSNKKLWSHLTLSQRFSASSLTNFGYHLSFIRSSEGRSFAVLIKDGYCTTVADDGDINTNPIIHVRTF
ncbi:MAG: hypothetical protein ACI9C0_000516 [Alteromonadaceae bacterium]|jgi:hypothetical protein|tara:strand:- start:106 stop:360 length:255 start_codon:yes stop_codon:yes gene_type:complete